MRSLIISLKISLLAIGLLSSQSGLAKVIAFECDTQWQLTDDQVKLFGADKEQALIARSAQTQKFLVDMTNLVWETEDRVLTDVVVSPNQISVTDYKAAGGATTMTISRIDLTFEDDGRLKTVGSCEIVENKVERAF